MSSTNATPRRVRVEPGVYKRQDGKFEIGWRDASGIQRWEKVDGGITAARRLLKLKHAARIRGEDEPDDRRLKFGKAADKWWEAHAKTQRPATQNAYGAGLVHLRAYFGTSMLRDIKARHVLAYIATKKAEGLKGWTVKGHLTVLSSVFSYSVRHLGHNGTNPVSLLKKGERPSTEDEKPKRILAADELARLLDDVDDSYKTMFGLAAETGCRLSEVLGLAWRDIDLDGETVTFAFQLDRKRQRQPLKTVGSYRCIEVTSELVGKLRKLKVASARSQGHDLVFITRDGSGHDQRNIGGRVLARAVKRAGLGSVLDLDGNVVEPAPTFHSLRHSHASALIADGWDVVDVSKRLGHSSVATTLRIYAHEFDRAGRSSGRRDRLASMYSSVEAPMEATNGSGVPQTATGEATAVLSLSRTAAGGSV